MADAKLFSESDSSSKLAVIDRKHGGKPKSSEMSFGRVETNGTKVS